jgi:hypothetical protein
MSPSNSLSNNQYLDRAEFNRLQVNNLLVNNLSTNSTSTRPFANKTYRLYTKSSLDPSGYIQYVFNENGTEYNLEGFITGNNVTFITNIHIYQSRENSNKYFSHMIFSNNNNDIFSRYCQTGMEFNNDYTQINFGREVGGSLFQYNSNSPLAAFAHIVYPPEQQETVKNMINFGFLLEDTEEYGRILTLVN